MTSLEIVILQYSNFCIESPGGVEIPENTPITLRTFPTQYCYFSTKMITTLNYPVWEQYSTTTTTAIFLQLVCFVEHVLIPHQLLIAQRFLLVKRPFSCQNPNYGSKDCFWISISCSIWQFYDLIQNDFSRRARSVFF